MKFFREIGKGTGGLVGKIVGETVRTGGESTGSKHLKEFGDDIEKASTSAGESVGQVTDGVLKTTTGIITVNGECVDRGVEDINESINRTMNDIEDTCTNAKDERDS